MSRISVRCRTGLAAIVVCCFPPAAISGAEPKPPLPQLVEVSAPTNVVVRHPHQIIATPLAGLGGDPLPDFLVDAVAFTRPSGRYPPLVAGGRIEFEAAADGPLFLAVSYEYDGNSDGGWSAEKWSEAKFLDDDWWLVARLMLFNSTAPEPQAHLVFVRQCRAGEKFAVRSRKYHPPVVIAAAAGRVAHADDVPLDDSLSEKQQQAFLSRKMAKLLNARRFDELERWTAPFLDHDPQFPSGRYKVKALFRTFRLDNIVRDDEQVTRASIEPAEAWLAAKPDSPGARLLLSHLYIELSRLLRTKNEAEAADAQRRALELLYELESAKPKLTDVYRTYGMLIRAENWDVELAKSTVLKAVDTGMWCPQVIGEGIGYVAWRQYEEPDRAAKMRALLDECIARSPERFRPAMYAACFKDLNVPLEIESKYGVDWPTMRASYAELEKLYPQSAINDQSAAYYAVSNGDREFAARMFERSESFAELEDELWDARGYAARKAWASADFTAGDQRRIVDHCPELLVRGQWLPDGRVFVADYDGYMGAYDLAAGAFWKGRDFSSWELQRAFPTPDGRHVAYALMYGRGVVSDFPELKVRIGIDLPDNALVQNLAATSDGGRLAVAVNRRNDLKIFDRADTPRPAARPADLEVLGATTDAVTMMAFRNDERELLTLDNSGTVKLWSAADLAELKSWQAHAKPKYAVGAVSNDGTRLATYGADKTVRVWSLPDGAKLAEFAIPGGHLGALDFSPDGRLLAGGEGNRGIVPCSIHLWNVTEQRPVGDFAGHKGSIVSLDFSSDGRTLLSAAHDLSIRLWDVPTE